MSSDLLFELGTEELPSASVWTLAEAFSNHLVSYLDEAGLGYSKVHPFATPRRIGLLVYDLAAEQPNKTIQRKGPAVSAAYDSDGNPTKALLGFAKSCGVSVDDLYTLKTDKGEWLAYEAEQQGEKTENLIPTLINQALKALPVDRPMRWGNEDIEFVRPVHWAVLLYGDAIIPADILGLKTGRNSKGHRFHCPKEVAIHSPTSYESQMRDAYVVADFDVRRQMIIEQVQHLAQAENAQAVMPEDLVDEVTSIVEWPRALLAAFDKDFLEVPAEALIASMQSHQKCFALRDKQEQLLAHFITVSNIDSMDMDLVKTGNEKVMRARLSDAAFFFNQDKKRPLTDYCSATAQVVFQAKLGSLQDKARRMQVLANEWRHALHLSEQAIERAALLSKCDLMTGMVGEFPELQGLMGYYYALNDGESKDVALALNEQYMPRFSGDELPQTPLGLALSLADRLDTLSGIFAIGKKPSGVKDPFKLRRHAQAVVRILASTSAKLQLSTLIEESLALHRHHITIPDSLSSEIKHFIKDRLQAFYQGQGYAIEQVLAILNCQDEWLYDFEQRLLALKAFVQLPEAASLSSACKRVNNILSGALVEKESVDEQLFQEPAEKILYSQLLKMDENLKQYYVVADYMTILNRLASLREPVDQFFDHVMVMADDPALKNNRLNILKRLQNLLMGVADISLLKL